MGRGIVAGPRGPAERASCSRAEVAVDFGPWVVKDGSDLLDRLVWICRTRLLGDPDDLPTCSSVLAVLLDPDPS